MKYLCLLSLLIVTGVLCDKKVNLDDIERDQLRSETRGAKKASETLRADESKYSSTKTEVNSSQQQRQKYHGPTPAPRELGNQVGDYAELQSYESFKYAAQPQVYTQEKYPESGADTTAYLQQGTLLSNPSEHQQPQQQQQYYIQEGRSSSSQHDYEPQQQVYQPEVLVGNQLQAVQQKAAAAKYVDASDDKGTYYVNIPMSQLLAYYQNFGIVPSKGKNAEQQISIPVYMPHLLSQNQVYAPTKLSYQPEVQYVQTYPKHTQAIFSKASKNSGSAHTSATATAHQQQPAAASHQQYTAPVETLTYPTYTSAYVPQYYITQQQHPQPAQYVQQQQQQHSQSAQYAQQQHQPQQQQQQVVYENYADIAYVHDNALYEQQQQVQHQQVAQQQLPHPQQQQQYYVPAALAEQLMTQILQEAGIQSTSSVSVQQPVKQEQQEQLQHDFAPPQYQAQKFRSSHEITHLAPISDDGSESFSKAPVYSSTAAPVHATHSQPKTLLDSYIPSHVIAAQDASRYRERPIKLESGFLPSKINFVRSYKKRKTE